MRDLPAPGGRCWIFCSLNAMPAWEVADRCELSKYFTEVKIISIDSAHKYTSISEGDVMIVDEAHRAGNRSTRCTKALHVIRSRFAFGIGLSGTVTHAGIEKCLSLTDLTIPGLAIFAKTWTAGETFKCLVKKKIGPRTVTALEKPTTEREAFNQWLAIGVQLLSPDSKEVQSAFKLPGQELHEVTLNDPWPPLEEDVARVANAVFEETGEFPHAQAVAHYLARDGLDKKLDWLAGELEGIDVGTQLVVFANYRDSLDGAEALLNTLGLTYVRVDGDVTGEDRSAAQRRFQTGEATVFLGQIHAASESMNLQCANISITLDVSWSCIDWSQALARTHRRGQLAPCLHIDLVANRLQARILDRLRQGADFSAECAIWQDLKRALPVGTP
jgi:SNF2 family DNA or RNA helicase